MATDAFPASTTAPKRNHLRRLFGFVRPYRKLFLSGLILTVLLSLLSPAQPAVIRHVVDSAIREGERAMLDQWILVLVGLLLLQGLTMYFQTLRTNQLAQQVMNDMRNQVFSHLIHLRMRFFDRTAIGRLQTRTISDIETLNEVFSQGLVTILGQSLQVFTILGVMLWTNWQLTLAMLAVMPIMLGATLVFRRYVRDAFNRVRKYVSELNAFTQEHIQGQQITQIFNREEEESRRFEAINRNHLKGNRDAILAYSIFFPSIEFISALATAIIVFYGSDMAIDGETTPGVLLMFIMLQGMFFRPIRMIAERFNTLQLGLVSAERIFNVLDTDEVIPNEPDKAESAALEQSQLEVNFREVWFAYSEEEWVLRGISFRVPPQTTTAIVGETGAGKSSIINVLTRYYDIQSGEICVGGANIRHLDKYRLRRNMALVLQEPFLFSGSIRDNVSLLDDSIPVARIHEAAQAIGAHEFIERFPGGYDYTVGERGMNLSTGQRQLLAILRVMVYDPNILLLDEATANIDTQTEQLCQQAIERVLEGRTAIIIAHRLSTIQRADQILVMDQGKILERGTHAELLKAGGPYKRLHDLQYGGAPVA